MWTLLSVLKATRQELPYVAIPRTWHNIKHFIGARQILSKTFSYALKFVMYILSLCQRIFYIFKNSKLIETTDLIERAGLHRGGPAAPPVCIWKGQRAASVGMKRKQNPDSWSSQENFTENTVNNNSLAFLWPCRVYKAFSYLLLHSTYIIAPWGSNY